MIVEWKKGGGKWTVPVTNLCKIRGSLHVMGIASLKKRSRARALNHDTAQRVYMTDTEIMQMCDMNLGDLVIPNLHPRE